MSAALLFGVKEMLSESASTLSPLPCDQLAVPRPAAHAESATNEGVVEGVHSATAEEPTGEEVGDIGQSGDEGANGYKIEYGHGFDARSGYDCNDHH